MKDSPKISNKPPAASSYVWQTRDLKCSAAWRSAGINIRRFIDFLEVEWMNRGGQTNGELLAPRRQLEAWGIPARHISDAINGASRLGLVDCIPGVGRRPSRFSLTWHTLRDGTPPSNRWRVLKDDELREHGEAVVKASRGYPKGSHKGIRREVIKPVTTSEGKSLDPKTRVSEGTAPIRVSYHGGDNKLSLSGGAVLALAGRRLAPRAA
jgi:hypothetical protein